MIRLRSDDARARLISLVRYGKVTPEQAEAEAAARGWPPFAKEPELGAADPLREPRWPIVMAVAWIAWRDPQETRQQSAGFRSECTHWVFCEWNQPVKRGTAFARRAGWFLESWSEPTTVRLALAERFLQAQGKLPATRQMSLADAERELWQALSEGRLVAEGFDENGRPVDIPEREWAYLKLFEERKRDALKYDALDRREPYTRVSLKRDDVLRLWPRTATYQSADEYSTWRIEPDMLKPIADPGQSGYVPLCSVVQWIMSEGGTRLVTMEQSAWDAAVQKLWPEVCSGEIELIGLRVGDSLSSQVPGHTLALMKVAHPLKISLSEMLLGAPSLIQCTPFDQAYWQREFNDKLYETGRTGPTWTHLQVRKSHVLARWPRPTARVSAEQNCRRWLIEQMKASPGTKPQSREKYWMDAKRRFPSLAKRQFSRSWQAAITESGAHGWSKAGAPTAKSNRNTN